MEDYKDKRVMIITKNGSIIKGKVKTQGTTSMILSGDKPYMSALHGTGSATCESIEIALENIEVIGISFS